MQSMTMKYIEMELSEAPNRKLGLYYLADKYNVGDLDIIVHFYDDLIFNNDYYYEGFITLLPQKDRIDYLS